MKISILHPSRSRPVEALNTMVHWLQNIQYPQEWEYILSVDSDDPELQEYKDLGLEMHKTIVGRVLSQLIVNDNKNIVQASNQAAKVATGDIFILVSDDFLCFKGWNVAITKALNDKSGVLKTYDGVQRWIVTLPIMTRDYYQSQGYFYYPKYEHMFCDTDQTHKADLQGKLIIRNDIVFYHDHYSRKGGTRKKDAVNSKADKTWDQGEAVYLQRCTNNFGIPGVKNILDLSPEAHKAGHIAWLKNKLMKGVRA